MFQALTGSHSEGCKRDGKVLHLLLMKIRSQLEHISVLCSDTSLEQGGLVYGEGNDVQISIICITAHDTHKWKQTPYGALRDAIIFSLNAMAVKSLQISSRDPWSYQSSLSNLSCKLD